MSLFILMTDDCHGCDFVLLMTISWNKSVSSDSSHCLVILIITEWRFLSHTVWKFSFHTASLKAWEVLFQSDQQEAPYQYGNQKMWKDTENSHLISMHVANVFDMRS